MSTGDRGPLTWMSSEHQDPNMSETGPPAASYISAAVFSNSQTKDFRLTLGFFLTAQVQVKYL